jgi:3-hydroxyacyl-[acyl-carrier-protein] dehydratase
MILLNDFYTILQKEAAPGVLKAKVAINAKHRILEGHFPGLPVVPGVCMLQMVRELMEVNTSKELSIITADNMKFLSVINPLENSEVDVSITYTEEGGKYTINATLFAGTITFFKLKATLQIS